MPRPEKGPATAPSGAVLLATFNVPFAKEAADFAVNAALDLGRLLIVANFVELELMPLSIVLGYDEPNYPEDLATSLEGPSRLATMLGVRVERLGVRSPRRVDALVQVAREKGVRLLVLGPDPARVSRRLLAKAKTAVNEKLDCLLWIAGEPIPR
ncbi:MAG: universal stress protein [Acidimicrobiales bacterium]